MLKKHRLPILLLFILVALQHTPLYAQGKSILRQQLMWYGYNGTGQINDKWSVQLEVQERHFIVPLAQHQALTRFHVHRKIGESGWNATGGMSLFFSQSNRPTDSIRIAIPELRPHIQFSNKQKYERITIDHRYRAEARFFHATNAMNTELEEGFDFGNFRFRYRFQLTYLLWERTEGNGLRLKFNDEIHLNAGRKIIKNTFDQNRIYGALNMDLNKNISVEIGFLKWIQQRADGSYINRDILRFVLFHKFNFYRKKTQEVDKNVKFS